MNAYVDLIGLPASTSRVKIPSPFKEENICVIVSNGVSTSMQNRTAAMYRKLNERISESIDSTPGNVGVFTASYKVLQGLVNNGIKELISRELFIERRNATSMENDKLISRFRSHADHDGAVLLGVAGGRNSEGQDFPGNDMNTVVIVGIPYARPTTRVKAQIEYMEQQFPNKGWIYGYQLPAMKRAAQAAGRPIRTLQDRGAIILLDNRYATSQIRGKMPEWIKKSIKVLPDKKGVIQQILNQFYNISG
jgi:DNA excision repair protein ERCC-2